MIRPAWRDGTIVLSGRAAMRKWVGAAVLWNGFGWPMAVLHTPVSWIVWLFSAAGLVLVVLAGRAVLHWHRFETATFVMDAVPGVRGGTLSGMVETEVQANAASEEGFQIALSCFRRRVHYRREDVDMDLLWRDEKCVRGRPYGLENPQRLAVPVFFEVPADQPVSTPEKKENRILWRLDVTADMPGLDYGVEIEVPVFDTTAHGGAADRLSSRNARKDATVFLEAGVR